MDLKRISFARQILPASSAALATMLLCGCATMSLTNLTPSSLPENPSGIYTFTLRVTPKSTTVVPDSIAPHIVVGAESHDMKKSDSVPGIYEFDYKLPTGQDAIGYYFLVNYSTEGNGMSAPREAYTEVAKASIVRRYVLSLEVNRGPVGARIGVLGRGFTPQDLVGFDGTAVRTVFESPTSLGFFVPALAPGRTSSGRPSRIHACTSMWPGSAIRGVPASLTSARTWPSAIRPISSFAREASLCSW